MTYQDVSKNSPTDSSKDPHERYKRNNVYYEKHYLAIKEEQHIWNTENGIYPLWDEQTDPRFFLEKKDGTPKQKDLLEIVTRVGYPYGWDLRKEFNDEAALKAIESKLKSRYDFYANGKHVGGTIIGNVEERFAGIYKSAYDTSSGELSIKLSDEDLENTIEIFKIGIWPYLLKKGYGSHFLPRVFDKLFEDGAKVIILDTRSTNMGHVVPFYKHRNMSVVGALTLNPDLITPEESFQFRQNQGLITDDGTIFGIPSKDLYGDPYAGTKEIRVTLEPFGLKDDGTTDSFPLQKPFCDSIRRLVSLNALGQQLEPPSSDELKNVVDYKTSAVSGTGKVPVTGFVLYEQEQGKPLKPIAYVLYSEILDKKGRPTVRIDEIHAIEERRTYEVAKTLLHAVAEVSPSAERLFLAIGPEDRAGHQLLKHIVKMGAFQPDDMVTLDASPLLKKEFNGNAFQTREIEENDIEKLKALNSQNNGAFLDQESLEELVELSKNRKSVVLVTFSADEEPVIKAVTIATKGVTLVDANTSVELSHPRSAADQIKTSEEAKKVIASVVSFVREQIEPHTGNLKLAWNIETGEGQRGELNPFYDALRQQDVDPAKQLNVFFTNGALVGVREDMSSATGTIRVPADPEPATVPPASEERAGVSAPDNRGGHSPVAVAF